MSGTGDLQNFNTLCKEIRQLGFTFWVKFGHLTTQEKKKKKKKPSQICKEFFVKKYAKVIKELFFSEFSIFRQ
jgi:hypothetical protein